MCSSTEPKKWKTYMSQCLLDYTELQMHICTAYSNNSQKIIHSIENVCPFRKSHIKQLLYCCPLLYLILVHERLLKMKIIVFLYHTSQAYEQPQLGSNYWQSKCPFIGNTCRLCTSKVTSRVFYNAFEVSTWPLIHLVYSTVWWKYHHCKLG